MKRHTDARVLMVALGLAPFIMVLGNSMFIPILPDMQRELLLTTVETGFILSAFSIPAALFIPLSGALSERFGRKKIGMIALLLILVGSFFATIAAISLPLQWQFPMIIVGRILQGIGAGGITPVAMILASELFIGQKRNEALGMLEVFNGLGKVISPIIGGILAMASWHFGFVIYFAVTLFSLAGILFFVKEQKREKAAFDWRSYVLDGVITFRYNWTWLLPIYMMGGVGMFLLFGFLFYLSYTIESVFPFSTVLKGGMIALPLAALMVASFWTSRTVKPAISSFQKRMLFGGFGMFFSAALLPATNDIVAFFCLLMVLAVGLGVFLPAASGALAASSRSNERSIVMSIYAMVRFLGVALGPVAFGVWMEDKLQSMFFAFFTVGVSTVVMMILWARIPFFKCEEAKML
ncbi:MFS transporter [Halalkalibacterium ligniniphilum]|uniref:MFS transporter n=1 Tax=Halalkalibacterium ligniniphilum TaxID=1134413 RepID=UPI00034A0633|nr:MFS transporter [Halalkalibacterium ligniniphilum]